MNKTYIFGYLRSDDITIYPDAFPRFKITATALSCAIVPWVVICVNRRIDICVNRGIDGHFVNIKNPLPEFTDPELIHIEHSLDTRPGTCWLCESIREKCKKLREHLKNGVDNAS